MIPSEEVMVSLIGYARSNLQDFVARSKNASDAIAYLLAELKFELSRATAFKTKDLLTFEKKEISGDQPLQASNK